MAAISVMYIVVTATLLTFANVFLGLGKVLNVEHPPLNVRLSIVRDDGIPRRTARTSRSSSIALPNASAKTTALDDVSLLVRRGELMTLLGPSGCGKTTLLNLVAGFLMPDGGEIAIDGRRVTDVPPYRREIGMMFQNTRCSRT